MHPSEKAKLFDLVEVAHCIIALIALPDHTMAAVGSSIGGELLSRAKKLEREGKQRAERAKREADKERILQVCCMQPVLAEYHLHTAGMAPAASSYEDLFCLCGMNSSTHDCCLCLQQGPY